MKIFKHRNFSLMFFGRIISNIGDSLYGVAAMLLIYQLGGSTFYTGLAGFLSILPRIVEFCSGPLIDKIPIKSLLVRTQIIQSGLLLLIPLASLLDLLSVALVLTLTPIISAINVLIFPAQMAALPKVLPEELLTRGNSLFTVAYQGVDIAFNGLAGILFVAIGPFALYTTNSITFLIGAIVFSMIRMPKEQAEASHENEMNARESVKSFVKNYLSDLREGLNMIMNTFLAKLLYGVIVLNLAVASLIAVFPEYGELIGGTEFVGFLLMAGALGSLIGALLAPSLKLEQFPLGKLFSYGFFIMGFLWIFAVMMPSPWLTLALYLIGWIPAGAINVLVFTMVQKTAPKHLTGRLMTATTSLSGMAAPLGALIGGSLGTWIGSPSVVFINSAIIILIALLWLINPVVRNIPPTKNLDQNTFANSALATEGN